MTDLQFTGDLGSIQGILFGLIVAGAAWALYFHQLKSRRRNARLILPTLRAGAIFLLIMMLTQPVLHHEKIIGELGRLFVVVDNSGSMVIQDQNMQLYRKVLSISARGQKLDGIDAEKFQALANFDEQETILAHKVTSKLAFNELKNAYQEFYTAYKELLSVCDYVQANPETTELQKQISQQISQVDQSKEAAPLQGALQGLLNTSRQLADITRNKADQKIAEAMKATPSLKQYLENFNKLSRWQRLQHTFLEGDDPLLQTLSKEHEVELLTMKGDSLESIWSSRLGNAENQQQLPQFLNGLPSGQFTDLNSALKLAEVKQKSALLLLSDGRHNYGESPLEQAKILGARGVKVYTISYGAEKEPQDISIREIESPETVFFQDQVRGSILFNDHMKNGQKFSIKLSHEGKTLWEKELQTDGSGLRKLDYNLPIEATVEKVLAGSGSDLSYKSLPIQLKAEISYIEGDRQRQNNSQSFNLTAATKKRRLLLVDQRPRWEFRYIKSMFERSQQWDVNTVVPEVKENSEAFKRGRENDSFPIDKKELFNYDLIVLGDVHSRLFNDDEITWLREFVEQRGGAIILIDGRRQGLASFQDTPLKSLMPVKWLSNNGLRDIEPLKLTMAGAQHNALQISPDRQKNAELWPQLPKPHWLAHVEALPGTETYVTQGEKTPRPVLVFRHFGAGKVIYSANEEFWRWRYKKGDEYHHKLWNQLSDDLMEKSFSVEDKHVAIDAGKTIYQQNEKADIRVRIRDKEGKIMLDATAFAVISEGDKIISKLPLKSNGNGLYSARTRELQAGNFKVQVRVEGISDHQIQAQTSFSVQEPKSMEMAELTVNNKLMRDLSLVSGGLHLPEESAANLKDELKSLSSGKLIVTDTALWQSYWYFLLVILLFTIEWVYRKRLGLL